MLLNDYNDVSQINLRSIDDDQPLIIKTCNLSSTNSGKPYFKKLHLINKEPDAPLVVEKHYLSREGPRGRKKKAIKNFNYSQNWS